MKLIDKLIEKNKNARCYHFWLPDSGPVGGIILGLLILVGVLMVSL